MLHKKTESSFIFMVLTKRKFKPVLSNSGGWWLIQGVHQVQMQPVKKPKKRNLKPSLKISCCSFSLCVILPIMP